jgi:16S rRNA (guanine527-N7)-methyltransferase
MELIKKYFPELSTKQLEQFTALEELYREWNEKINVISRKDMDHLYEHHVLHSLAIAKQIVFEEGMVVLDIGTGGGFPGIPLAIFFPQVKFILLDSIAKKIKVVNEVITTLNLDNAEAVCSRAEDYKGHCDYVVSRAVSSLRQMVTWTGHLVPSHRWIMLKGGDPKEIRKEIAPYYDVKFIPICNFFTEPYFQDKYIVTIEMK